MAARGWRDAGEACAFLSAGLAALHDPASLPDIDVAVERLVRAVRSREPICIYGDYDVDGTTGSALLLRVFAWLGAAGVTHRTPHRLLEGYGLHPQAVDEIAAEGVRLIITVDNGSTARAALARARERGVDVIVTDHHQLGAERADCLALVNPCRPGSAYPFSELCGCAVAFKLAQALVKAMGRSPAEAKPFLTSLLEFVAVATVSDVMPLHGENRAIVRYGVSRLTESSCLGLRALIGVAGLAGKVSAENIGWVIGPRLNAAGRTRHASIAVELLTTESESRATELARELETLNRERQDIERAMVEQALEELDRHREDPVIVLARPGWHRGVLGIVASRVLERVERPVLLMAIEDGLAHGSGRSTPGFDLHAALCACAGHLAGFGGHPMAAGLTCETRKIDGFRAAIIAHALALGPEALAPRPHTVDTELAVPELVTDTVRDLERLAPFGQGHPRPLFALRGLRLADTPRVMKERHLRLRLTGGDGVPVSGVAWRLADRLRELLPSPRGLDLLGRPTVNEWNGTRRIEFTITDWRVTEP